MSEDLRYPIGDFNQNITVTPEMREKSLQGWKEWMEAHKDNLADWGAPLGKNMRVTKKGSIMQSNEVGGYSIIQAESQEAAMQILADNPSLRDMPDSYMEVMEIMPI